MVPLRVSPAFIPPTFPLPHAYSLNPLATVSWSVTTALIMSLAPWNQP